MISIYSKPGIDGYYNPLLGGWAPRTCKWLITMVIVSPLNEVIPLPNGLNWL